MKIYEPMVGERIDETIKMALSYSYYSYSGSEDVQFTFNGLSIVVNASVGNESYYSDKWDTLCKERSIAYKNSPEYKSYQEERLLDIKTNQNEMDKLILNLQDNFHTYHNVLDLARWLKRFAELSDNVDVSYNKSIILHKLEQLGYKENEYVGYKGEWDTITSIRYIAGQVINCLESMGLIPPVAATMLDKVLKEGSL